VGDGLGDQLAASAFVSGQLTIGVDLAFEDVENAWACSDRFKFRVAATSKETIDLKLLGRVEPFLSVIIEHVFGGNIGNVEALQSSNDGSNDFLCVVGIDTFDLLQKPSEVLDRSSVVTGRNAELLDICVLVFREFDSIRIGRCEPVVPAFVERWVVSSSRCLADFSG
jgi:hypothetical protein